MDFEIFKVGTHTSDMGITKDYSLDDLNFIAHSYDPKTHEAPIVVGHPKHDSPAMGWIDSIKVVGDRLFASAKQIIPEFVTAVKQGLFKKRSISLDKDGKLRHVGFLGGAVPAVKGLADIQFAEGECTTFELDDGDLSFTEEESAFSEKENQSQMQPDLSQLITELSNVKAALLTLSQNFSEDFSKRNDFENLSNKISALDNKINLSSFTKLLDDKVSSGSLTPAMKNKIESIVDYVTTQNYSSVDLVKFRSDITHLFSEFVNSVPKFLNFQNFAEKEERTRSQIRDEFENYTVDAHSSELHKEATLLMKKESISYIQSINKILNKN